MNQFQRSYKMADRVDQQWVIENSNSHQALRQHGYALNGREERNGKWYVLMIAKTEGEPDENES